jgi:signal peptidase I
MRGLRPAGGRVTFWAAAALGGVVAVLGSAAFFARTGLLVVRVVGHSMVPTLRAGERVLALRSRYGRPLRRGDVVVCRLPARSFGAPPGTMLPLLVKRAVALPGDPMPGGGRVPADHVFIVGDHSHSNDSRQFGPIPTGDVVGRVIARLTAGQSPDPLQAAGSPDSWASAATSVFDSSR